MIGDVNTISELPTLPSSFRPILWSLRWRDIDTWVDREDIILNTLNEGNLSQWRWIRKVYGDKEIGRIIKQRMISEFHPESRRLAELVFNTSITRNAR